MDYVSFLMEFTKKPIENIVKKELLMFCHCFLNVSHLFIAFVPLISHSGIEDTKVWGRIVIKIILIASWLIMG